jgi:DNA-binding LytR/AlgR family response regulator
MKIEVIQTDNLEDTEITIRHNNPQEAARLIDLIRASSFRLEIRSGNETMVIDPNQIYYFESVDDKVFCYLKNSTHETSYKLYELEEKLARLPFLRVSKGIIINTAMIRSFTSAFSGRLICTLKNGEKIIISRMYVKALKEKMGLNRGSDDENN